MRYALTIDRDEKMVAAEVGIKPRFEIVSLRALIAIDALWSQQTYTLPVATPAIYQDVYVKGISYNVPSVAKAVKLPIPPTRYIPVKDWDDGAANDYTGMRSVLLQMFDTPVQDIEVKGERRSVMMANTGQMSDVDEESAGTILLFELDRLVNGITKLHARRADTALASLEKGTNSIFSTARSPCPSRKLLRQIRSCAASAGASETASPATTKTGKRLLRFPWKNRYRSKCASDRLSRQRKKCGRTLASGGAWRSAANVDR